MVWKFFKGSQSSERAANRAFVSEGTRIYAIGDIHGCLTLLNALLARIAEDDAQAPKQRRRLFFLGDYIDRGPASREVLEKLALRDVPLPFVLSAAITKKCSSRFYLIRRTWTRGGTLGLETLHSFGINVRDMLLERVSMPHDRNYSPSFPRTCWTFWPRPSPITRWITTISAMQACDRAFHSHSRCRRSVVDQERVSREHGRSWKDDRPWHTHQSRLPKFVRTASMSTQAPTSPARSRRW